MLMKKIFAGMLALTAAIVLPASSLAQDYPSKPISIIVPYAAGGGVDQLARLVADQLNKTLNVPVVVENRSGANGNIGSEYVARANPDGYTLLYSAPGPLAINKLLYAKLNYDSDAFVPISQVSTSPNVLVVHPKHNITTIQQLIAYAKANPGRLNYASPGAGGTPHLSAELFKMLAGVSMVHVPYRGTAPLMTDVLAGNVDLTFSGLGNVLQYVQTQRLRAIGVGSAKRNTALPDVQPLSEVLPGFISATWDGLVAPPGTSRAIVERLYTALNQSFKQAETVQRALAATHIDAVVGSPAELTAHIKTEQERWGKVIDAIGIKEK
jgi:tripartite-type tricarboxylate transporter receptor subunit TctC